jgi:hypothetical protein
MPHKKRQLFRPGSGRHLWCRRCTCVSTRKEWTANAPAAPACPECGAGAHEARDWDVCARVNHDLPAVPALHTPYPLNRRKAGYDPRRQQEPD